MRTLLWHVMAAPGRALAPPTASPDVHTRLPMLHRTLMQGLPPTSNEVKRGVSSQIWNIYTIREISFYLVSRWIDRRAYDYDYD